MKVSLRNALGTAAAIAAFGFISSVTVMAADLGQPFPRDYGDTRPTIMSWTGCHVSGHVGTSWGNTSASSALDGNYLGGALNVSTKGFYDDAVQIGAGVGCDWQPTNTRFVLGVLGDYSNGGSKIGGDVRLNGLGLSNFDVLRGEFEIEDQWFLGARLGFLVTPNFLVYGLAGHTWARTSDMQVSLLGIDLVKAGQSDMSGWTLGGGLETRLSDNWFARGEYRYTSFGRENASFGGVTLASTQVDDHSVRGAVVYRFGATR